jgi:hypothetical protein
LSRARTLFDAVYDWSRFGSLPRAYDWIRADLSAERVRPAQLVCITQRYGDVGAIRWTGARLDREGKLGYLHTAHVILGHGGNIEIIRHVVCVDG